MLPLGARRSPAVCRSSGPDIRRQGWWRSRPTQRGCRWVEGALPTVARSEFGLANGAARAGVSLTGWRGLCSEGHPPHSSKFWGVGFVRVRRPRWAGPRVRRACGPRPPATRFAAAEHFGLTFVGPLASPDRVAPQPLFATSPRTPFPHQHLASARRPLPLPTAASAVVWCCHSVCRLGDGRSGGSTRARDSSGAPSSPLERPPFLLLAASVKRPLRRPPTRCRRRGSPFARDAALPPRNDGRADEPWAS